jgi:hypothetical protein
MKLNRLAFAAGILLGASGAALAQSSAFIFQSGSNDQALIDQDASVPGSTAYGQIIQSQGADNTAIVQQGPNGSGAPISATARVAQQRTFGNLASVVQIGTTAGTNAELTQSGGSDSFGRIWQSDVSASQATGLQSSTNGSIDVQQGFGSASAYAATEQAGDASLIYLQQGRSGAGVSATQARVFQNGNGNIAMSQQYGVSGSSSYISQGSAQQPGSYYSGGEWVEVDASVIGEPAAASTASVSQGYGSNLTGYILQYGSEHYGSLGQTGTGNLGGIVQTGFGNTANISQSGAFGTATIAQRGSLAYGSIDQSGTGNNASIRQR